jgi:CheY-like chemotaxis protein/HPt (histidine-containing phosphotransfer) domain-containing protein
MALPVILIVDDVLENVRLLKNLLEDFGQIVFARDGLAALDLAARHHPDIVLLDVMMPGLDGYETCRRLKAQDATRDTPVLFVTGADGESDEAKGLAAGAIDYITKPFAPGIVRARVQNHLALVIANAERKRMDAELRASHAQVAAQAAQLESQNETLQENVRLREEVERISRHDLKTPLNSIIAVPRLLREKQRLDPEDEELLTIIERAGYRILSMVNLSLDLFKMEQSTYRFRPHAVDLMDLLGKLSGDLRRHAGSRKVIFQVQPWHEPRVYVWAEELLCYSILGNLMKNALEASPDEGCVSMRISREGDQVSLHMHNQGAVPELVRERFFEKYSTAGKADGSGLGTYSARLMARAQGGDIEMQTSEQEGTTLVLRLQAAPTVVEPSAGASDALPRRREGMPGAEIAALKVLVVDDDEYNLLVMKRYMPGPPVEVYTAINGRAGLDSAMNNRPDLIFMDLEMPVMNGIDAVRRLREHEKNAGLTPCVIVALSAHDDEVSLERSIKAGCNIYLAKPASMDQVHAVLHKVAGTSPAKAAPAQPDAGAAEPVYGIDDEVCVDSDLRDALPAFLQSRREVIDSMTLACAMHDTGEVRQLAHRLAGSFALYGFRWAGKHCQQIERDAAVLEPGAQHEQLTRLRLHLRNVTIRFIDL